MRHNPRHATADVGVVRELIAEHPWATIVSHTADGLVASHYPVLIDDATDQLTLVTHVGRPDERIHDLGTSEVLIIIQGRHGYVSPSWYAPGAVKAPTWNHSTVHLHGTPQLLDAEENLKVLTRLVAHFEQHVDDPMWLDPVWAEPVARGTVGVRIPIERFVVKVKLSQDKDPESIQNVIDHLREPGAYQHTALAGDMEKARTTGLGYPEANV